MTQVSLDLNSPFKNEQPTVDDIDWNEPKVFQLMQSNVNYTSDDIGRFAVALIFNRENAGTWRFFTEDPDGHVWTNGWDGGSKVSKCFELHDTTDAALDSASEKLRENSFGNPRMLGVFKLTHVSEKELMLVPELGFEVDRNDQSTP